MNYIWAILFILVAFYVYLLFTQPMNALALGERIIRFVLIVVAAIARGIYNLIKGIARLIR